MRKFNRRQPKSNFPGPGQICFTIPGNPELIVWPKVSMLVQGEALTVDFLVRVREGDLMHWIIVEIDEGGVITPESRRREQLLQMPTLRVNDDDLAQPDFMGWMLRKVVELVGNGAGEFCRAVGWN